MEIIIRPANDTLEEDVQIGNLLVNSFTETYARKMPEVIVTELRKAKLRDVASRRSTYCVLIAEVDGLLAGTVTLAPSGHTESRAWTPRTCDLRYVAVDPAFQGQGISQALIHEAHNVAHSWNADAICIHVRRGAKGLIRFYSQLGYLRTPEGDLDLLPEIFLEAYLLRLKS